MKISKLVVLTGEVQYALHSTQRENDMLFIPLNFPLSRPRFSIIFFSQKLFISLSGTSTSGRPTSPQSEATPLDLCLQGPKNEPESPLSLQKRNLLIG